MLVHEVSNQLGEVWRASWPQESSYPLGCRCSESSHLTLSALSLLVLWGAGGCGDVQDADTRRLHESERISVVGGQQFDELFIVLDSLVLEESNTVVTVAPRVSLDSGGGFLVADSREHQVRVYSNRGELRNVFGAGTERAYGIERPTRAKRLSNGDILVTNLVGPVTLIPSFPDDEAMFIPTALRTARDFQILNEREVLIVGTDSAPPTASLHILDMFSGQVVRRLFPPPGHLDEGVTTTFSSVSTALRGNRLAVAHMLSDTLVFFDRSGLELSRVRIPIDPFVAPIGPLPNMQTTSERLAWTSQFTHIVNVFWIEADQLIIQWQKVTGGVGVDRGILQMDTTGTRAWAIAPAPTLIAVRGDEFFFDDPQTDAPNHWIVARRKFK